MPDHRDMNAVAPSLKRLLKWIVRARDARWMWDLFGPLYNRHILEPLSDLYEHIARSVDVNSRARILDVGCGPGYVTLLLAGRLPSAFLAGIDYSATQVHAAERLRRQKALANCRFQQGNATAIPFASDHFDAVVSVGSIKHWKDPRQGLREMCRSGSSRGCCTCSRNSAPVRRCWRPGSSSASRCSSTRCSCCCCRWPAPSR